MSLRGAKRRGNPHPQNLTVLDALQPKWQHFGERIATSGYALLAMTAFSIVCCRGDRGSPLPFIPENKKRTETRRFPFWYAGRDSVAFSPGSGRKQRCHARPAGHEQPSPGRLYLNIRVPGNKKERTPEGVRSGTPEGTRTPDLLIRSQSLYPTELPAHVQSRLPAYNNMGLLKCQALFFKILKNFLSVDRGWSAW